MPLHRSTRSGSDCTASSLRAGQGLEPVVRWGLAFYVKDGEEICYLKPDKDFICSASLRC